MKFALVLLAMVCLVGVGYGMDEESYTWIDIDTINEGDRIVVYMHMNRDEANDKNYNLSYDFENYDSPDTFPPYYGNATYEIYKDSKLMYTEEFPVRDVYSDRLHRITCKFSISLKKAGIERTIEKEQRLVVNVIYKTLRHSVSDSKPVWV
jgi:hypothetical protein